jgi:hypothetical protein
MLLALASAPILGACAGEEGRMRAVVAGEYVFEIGDDYNQFRQVLTLREDSRWTKVTSSSIHRGPVIADHADSGSYRIHGVTITLRSDTEPAAVPYRYTFSGDTLYQSNAAHAYAVTGYDIGERIMVRSRQELSRIRRR